MCVSEVMVPLLEGFFSNHVLFFEVPSGSEMCL